MLKYLTADTCKLLYMSLIEPLFECCDIVWSNVDRTSLDRLPESVEASAASVRLQKRGACIILQKKIREERSEN